MDEAARVDREQRAEVVEAGLPSIRPRIRSRIASASWAVIGATGREADVAALLASVPAGHVVHLEVGDAALDPLGRMLEVWRPRGVVLRPPDLRAGDPLERRA